MAHLEQYGYAAPPGAVAEPADPCGAGGGGEEEEEEGMCYEEEEEDGGEAAALAGRYGGAAAGSRGASPARGRTPVARLRPASPVAAAAAAGYQPSRLGTGQPGSPLRGAAGAAAAANTAAAPATAAGAATAPRRSLGGASAASLTPEGLSSLGLLSPGLADKYACPSSSDVPSLGGASAPGGASPPLSADAAAMGAAAGAAAAGGGGGGGGGGGADGSAQRGAGGGGGIARDLRLDYGRAASDSPNMPVIGEGARNDCRSVILPPVRCVCRFSTPFASKSLKLPHASFPAPPLLFG